MQDSLNINLNKLISGKLRFFKKIFMNNRHLELEKWLSIKNLRVLDVGCGSHSASYLKAYFPNIKYYGIDRIRDYENDERDFSVMEHFYQVDVDNDDLDQIPNNFFHLIICAQVIEHLNNGEILLSNLAKKLKRNGILYVDFPNEKSVNFPSMARTLNFYDDKTHIRVYSLEKISQFINKSGFQTIKKGTYRNLVKILITPIYIAKSLRIYHKITALGFWDIFGFVVFGIWKKI